MHALVSSRDNFCNFVFFDCFTTREADNQYQRKENKYVSLRETTVHYQQPHLIEPMKLTVYEDLPTTPISATPSRPFFSRATNASRASSRASLFSLRKRGSKQSSLVLKPTIQTDTSDDLTRRRRRAFRPLELSIYVAQHRLSDLPEFDRFSFTDLGELKDLDAVLSRPQSAVLPPLQHTPLLALRDYPKSTSMYELSTSETMTGQTAHSTASVSRPPSEYDALHSHPVSWASLPGLSIVTSGHKVEKSVAILTPMEEEFSPDSVSVPVGDTILAFPKDGTHTNAISVTAPSSLIDLAAPAPVISRGVHHENYKSKSVDDLSRFRRSTRHASMHKQSISQWLTSRQRTNSTSTIASTATTTSFAEHRRKREEFYQLGQHARVAVQPVPCSPNMSNNSDTLPFHRRTVTGSTIASTVDTEILSYDGRRASADTWTTASDMLRSQTGTIKSITSPGGRKIVTATVNDLGLLTPLRGQVHVVDEETSALDDIRHRMRVPSIGVAF